MKEKYYIKKIEELNFENIKLQISNEYIEGKKIIDRKEIIKNKKITLIIKKIVNKMLKKDINKEIQKYNAHEELENNFNVNKEFLKKPKIVVYTCITGKYDDLAIPFLEFDNIDYVLFTDDNIISQIWNVKKIPDSVKKIGDNLLINRYIKMHPHELFDFNKYDYSIYVDGNVKIMSDLTELVGGISDKTGLAIHRHRNRNCIYNEAEVCRLMKKGNYNQMQQQLGKYSKEGFPKEFGLYECTIIVSDLKNNISKEILHKWWEEFLNSESNRDQIALPYVIWKNKFNFDDIGSLGDNLYRNPKFKVSNHKL